MKKNKVMFFVIMAIITISSLPALAGGFRIYSQSTSSLSQGDAMVAHYEDASSMFYNPATITKAKKSQIMYDHLVFNSSVKFRNDDTSTRGKSETYHIPHVHFLHKFNDKVAAGLVTIFPYGLSREWAEDWRGRYTANKGSIETYTVNPNIAIKLLPNLSLGGGFSYMQSNVELRQRVNSSALLGGPADDIDVKLDGNGDGWGYNLGVLLDITDKIHLGVSYRSQINVNYTGRTKFNIPSNASPLSVSPFFTDQDARTDINFPAVMVFGVSTTLFDKLDLEVNADWTGWSSYDNLIVQNELVPKTVYRKKYKNVWTLHFGGRYRTTENILLRFGYYYDVTPVPSEYMGPMVPGTNKHGISFGGRYSFSNTAINLGYQAILYKDRYASNVELEGTYSPIVHLFGASFEYNFSI